MVLFLSSRTMVLFLSSLVLGHVLSWVLILDSSLLLYILHLYLCSPLCPTYSVLCLWPLCLVLFVILLSFRFVLPTLFFVFGLRVWSLSSLFCCLCACLFLSVFPKCLSGLLRLICLSVCLPVCQHGLSAFLRPSALCSIG